MAGDLEHPSEQIKGINSNKVDGFMVLVRIDMNL